MTRSESRCNPKINCTLRLFCCIAVYLAKLNESKDSDDAVCIPNKSQWKFYRYVRLKF